MRRQKILENNSDSALGGTKKEVVADSLDIAGIAGRFGVDEKLLKIAVALVDRKRPKSKTFKDFSYQSVLNLSFCEVSVGGDRNDS